MKSDRMNFDLYKLYDATGIKTDEITEIIEVVSSEFPIIFSVSSFGIIGLWI